MQVHSPSAIQHFSSELDRLGDQIAELSAHLDAATARLLALIREFDARGGWNTGFRSCAEWLGRGGGVRKGAGRGGRGGAGGAGGFGSCAEGLGWGVGLHNGAAREWVRVARALGTLPRLTEALSRGELSYSKVRALNRVATPDTGARLSADCRA